MFMFAAVTAAAILAYCTVCGRRVNINVVCTLYVICTVKSNSVSSNEMVVTKWAGLAEINIIIQLLVIRNFENKKDGLLQVF